MPQDEQGGESIIRAVLALGEIPLIIGGTLLLVVICLCLVVWRILALYIRMKTRSTKVSDGYFQVETYVDDRRDGNNGAGSLPFKYELRIDYDFMQGERIRTATDTLLYKCTVRKRDLLAKGADNSNYVVKVFANDEHTMRQEKRMKFISEVAVMFKLQRGSNIAKIVGYSRTPAAIIMKRYDHGNLDGWIYMKRDSPKDFLYTKSNVLFVLSQVLQGIHFIHRQKYIHADLNPTNILLEKDGNDYFPVITDFSSAQPVDAKNLHSGVIKRDAISYTAPEILMSFQSDFEKQGQRDRMAKAGDVYAWALICVEILQRQLWSPPHPLHHRPTWRSCLMSSLTFRLLMCEGILMF